jgi:mRNA-degrading endonuclease RelE of RelBE toxin-antitoxin system
MKQPFWSQFWLRVGNYRVYYDVAEQEQTVIILQVFRKGSGATPDDLP